MVDKNKCIIFNTKLDTKSIELLYEQIGTEKTDLFFAKNISDSDLFIIPKVIQFVATWYRQSKIGKLIFEVSAEKESLKELYKLDFFFTIITFCWKGDITNHKNENLKLLLFELNTDYFKNMRNQDFPGQKSILSCFDHLSSQKGLLSTFYSDEQFITNEFLFENAINKSLKKVLSLNRELKVNNISRVYDEIVAVIYELMKNTDDWGRTDINNVTYNPNTRGLYLKFHRRKIDFYNKSNEDVEGLSDYFSNSTFVVNNLNEAYFLEISVFDTGLGFIERNKGLLSEISLSQKAEIITKCLIQNFTSSTGRDKLTKGIGLYRIMNILNNKGLFNVRSENISLFRNLVKNPFYENEDIVLYDWLKNSNTEYTAHSKVCGSVVSVLIPISNLANNE